MSPRFLRETVDKTVFFFAGGKVGVADIERNLIICVKMLPDVVRKAVDIVGNPPQFQCQLCQLGNYSRSGLSLQEQQRQASHDKGKSLRRIGSQRTERYHQQLASGRKLQG